MDKLYVKDLEVFANHGVFEEEKRLGQLFLISLELTLDLYAAATTGNLDASVNYGVLCHEVEAEFKKESYDLIETAGEKLAAFVLNRYPMVRSLKVTIKKPWAPIARSLKYAAIEINRGWHRAFIGFGSNMGERESIIEKGLALLTNQDTIRAIKQSTIIETPPWGYSEQNSFLNGVLEIETTLSPTALLKQLLETETQLGRERKIHWGPRTLDLDLLFYDDLICDSETLTLPHPYIQERLFVLEPLAEIAPNFIHPVLNKSLRSLKEERIALENKTKK